MDNNNNPTEGSGQGKFFSGFLIGMLVGAAVVFLLGTKKGKKLLKAISEEGVDNISNLLEKAEETEDLDEVSEKPPNTRAASFADPRFAEGSGEERVATKAESEGQGKSFTPKREFIFKEKSFQKAKVRRFFRGISRHVN